MSNKPKIAELKDYIPDNSAKETYEEEFFFDNPQTAEDGQLQGKQLSHWTGRLSPSPGRRIRSTPLIQESLSQRLVDYYAGIMQVFYAVCSNEMTLLLQRAAQAFIRDEYSRLSAVTTILATWQDG